MEKYLISVSLLATYCKPHCEKATEEV